MSERKLFSITGVFNNPDDIIRAAEEASETGYTKYDIHTPYPVHGMDDAMRLGPSRLSYVALAAGLTALLGAFALLWWITGLDYPVIIGGKPHFSPPAFVPVLFEVIVLTASIVTVVAMLFIYFKLPNNSYPLHGTEYMKMVAADKYGISIQKTDPKFDENEVKAFLSNIGALEIQEIYYDEEEANVTNRVFEPKFIVFLIITAIFTSGVTYFGFNVMQFLPPFNWMMEQQKVLPQEISHFFADGQGMRQPVEGTIARGSEFYQFRGNQAAASITLVNPLLPSKANLENGKKNYNVFCSPCHGYLGKGDSRLRGQFPNPPTLHSDKVRDWTDGDFYHVITVGQNIMPPYASQILPEERWAIILYIRALQRSQNARETDL